MDFLQWVLFFVIIYGAMNALRYSRESRRTDEPRERGKSSALMNIYLGTMLIAMAIIQLFYYEGSTVRVVIGSLFLLLGVFNVWAGSRNYKAFK